MSCEYRIPQVCVFLRFHWESIPFSVIPLSMDARSNSIRNLLSERCMLH